MLLRGFGHKKGRALKTFWCDNVVMMVTLSATCRADGTLDYSKDGPGPFKSVLPTSKLAPQLSANNAYQDERQRFERDLKLFGRATISFPDRRHEFRAC
jgi:hypothetical protein